ncbi:hypothetical protein BKA70DRAFT_1293686 [Coprinopsis sp. MPI-PUGE-AT-0042]|nr:hypothetical protein BKA70DRAFT_1293686 [Coprinopsis sp. MPI-PUGE-AT-0042]
MPAKSWYLFWIYSTLLHHYAHYSFQHAMALRPYDVQLWQAQGSCYEEARRPREAIERYKRALISSETHEATPCFKLARIHRLLEEHGNAVA